jgi:hypothetical protein
MILLFNKPGPPGLIIRTNPYGATRLAFSQDGSLWALVWNAEAEKRGEDYGIFHRYTPDGRLVGEFVMRSTFPIRGNPASHGGDKGGGLCYLWATRNGVGAYFPLVGEWVELDNSGKLVGRWHPKAPVTASGSFVEHVAFTDSGSVYAYLGIGFRRVLCRLNKSAGAWEPIDGTDFEFGRAALVPRFLYGTDGDHLVFRGPGGDLVWLNEPR